MKKLIVSLGAATVLVGAIGASCAAMPSWVTPSDRDASVATSSGTVPAQRSALNQQFAHAASSNDDGNDGADAEEETFVHPDLGKGAHYVDTPHFRIHYTLHGDHAVSSADANTDGTPDYVAAVATTLEHVRAVSINTFGWAAPPPDGAHGGNALYDVYLKNLTLEDVGGYVDGGQPDAIVGDNPNTPNVVEPRASISYMSLDRSYEDPEDPEADPRQELQSVAAHEFMHSIQMGYDGQEPADWLWEATAEWMMEEVYPENNLGHENLFNTYDSPDVAQSGPETDWYAQWLFFRYISEQYGHGAVKALWEEARTRDGYAALEAALKNEGTTLDDVIRGYSLALLTNRFQEGAVYPTVRLEGAIRDQFQPPDGVASMGADYVELLGDGPLTVMLEAIGLEGRVVDIRDGKASVFPLTAGQATVDGSAFAHLYLIVQNLQRPDPVSNDGMIGYSVIVRPGRATPAQIVAAPNFKAPQVAERTVLDDN
ncbi:MAG: DUF6055 domain-containing protein, partial [Chloroflexales bacterium]|nr:DUF6055 domain-containing protein [Chloroflexales bacterium]